MNVHQQLKILFRVIGVIMLFALVVGMLIAANVLSSLEGDPYQTFFERLQPAFYIRTAVIIIISSLLYTPISYGISYYFWQSDSRLVGLVDIFFLFGKFRLFIKAIGLRLLIWLVRGMGQLLALMIGVLLETAFCVINLIKSGLNVLNITLEDIPFAVETYLKQGRQPWLSVCVWGLILVWMAIMGIKFMFCKYALLRFDELSVIECLQIGLVASRHRLFALLRYFWKYFTYYIIMTISFGLLYKVLKPFKSIRFSSMAIQWVTDARGIYFREKAEKSLDK